jgi:hypothetical protein
LVVPKPVMTTRRRDMVNPDSKMGHSRRKIVAAFLNDQEHAQRSRGGYWYLNVDSQLTRS